MGRGVGGTALSCLPAGYVVVQSSPDQRDAIDAKHCGRLWPKVWGSYKPCTFLPSVLDRFLSATWKSF